MIQRAVLVRWMAFGLMAAALLNLVVLFVAFPVPWPTRPADVFEQLLIFIAGVCLLKQGPGRWLLALTLIFSAVGLGLWTVLEAGDQEMVRAMAFARLSFSGFLAFCVALLLYYARYPFLDRRQGWVGAVARRYQVSLPAKVFADREWSGVTESISASGCRIRLEQDWGPKDRVRFIDVQFPGFSADQIKAQVVGSKGTTLRLKFRDFRNVDRKGFLAWMKGLHAGA